MGMYSQTAATGRQGRPAITERIDGNKLHQLRGNTRSEANAANDLGRVEDSLPMEHMLLQLQRPADQEKLVTAYIQDLHNPKSPNFHKWMTAAQFGQTYGPAQQDIDTVTGWLTAQGFTVNSVYPSGMTIDFSGTAGQVRSAFQTEVHRLNVNGQAHIANMSDPQIPAALAPVVAGVVSIHDFTPRPMKRTRPKYTFSSQGTLNQAITPGDLATIYNLTPLFNDGYTGKGQTVAVIEDADPYSTADWDTFRAAFGLSQYSSGSLSVVHPQATNGSSNCTSPGSGSGDDGETILDAEWASAAAPDATILVASCGNTRNTFGGLIALQNLINSSNPPAVISISYGDCEADNGASANAAFNAVYQQAVAEGVSIFVAAGDEGAAGCDAGVTGATHGIAVSGYASTPYNVAVGGTDFGDSYTGSNAGYWSQTNSTNYSSAMSYIPEIPWNDSCAGSLLVSFLGFDSPYGANGLCGSSTAQQQNLLSVSAGSGGPSGCATGAPTTADVVSGTCQGYAKPEWQAGVAGIPNDSVRDLPDVSLFAGIGTWGHYYVMCWSDVRNGGASCTGDPSTWAGGGGTSFSAPIMAGIQALVNQKTGSSQGNPNYVYYKLAANASVLCDTWAGDTGACVFHSVSKGDIAVNCGGNQNCYGATAQTSSGGPGRHATHLDANGALSVSSGTYDPAYGAASGWNFATGIGSVNAYNLVNNWNTVQ